MGLLDKFFPRPVKPENYSKLVIEEFRRNNVIASASASDPFELTLGQESKVFLNNAYSQYCSAGDAERAAKVTFFVSAQLEERITLTNENLDQLLPVVRSNAFYSLLDLTRRAEGNTGQSSSAFETFGPGIAVGLVVDSEKAMTLVQSSDLDALGLTFGEALNIALKNLETGFEHTFIEHADGLYIGDWSDGYDSSRILLPSVWSDLKLKGIPLIHIPSRDKFFIFGASDPFAMELALRLGEEEHFGAYPLSCDMFAQHDGKWKVGVPAAPESKAIQDRMVRRRLALDYAQQKELLERIYERDHIDLFVASYSLYNDPPDQFSASVWSRGIPTLLPQTDQVILLVDPDKKITIRVSWEALRKVCIQLMPRVRGLYPNRSQVVNFPTDVQIDQLRTQAIPE